LSEFGDRQSAGRRIDVEEHPLDASDAEIGLDQRNLRIVGQRLEERPLAIHLAERLQAAGRFKGGSDD
jgi:hypothetical protein